MEKSIISVTSFKGGVGKTTTSLHLAGALATSGERVAVMDRDRTRSATTWARNGNLGFPVGTEQTIFRISDTLDTLVIDSRGGVEVEELREMAETSDFLILPTNVEYMSLDAMAQTAMSLAEMNRGNYAVLLTMARPGRRLDEAREVLGELGLPMLTQTVRASEAFKDASQEGVLVNAVRSNRLASACWQDYLAVAAEIKALVQATRKPTGPGVHAQPTRNARAGLATQAAT